MKVGILSDTHGAIGRGLRALELLLQQNVEVVLHCGDIGSSEMLDELATLCEAHRVPFHCVLGNVDGPELRHYRATPMATTWGEQADFELDGQRICIMHGHDRIGLSHAIAGGQFDYVFTGHTHQAADHREGRTRVINPGAVYRAHPPSVAVLDTATDHLEYFYP
ncbi:MAG: YfcE family phosphodiesterase [Kiritimatiellae bacterium]|nr:YfcE family phosphodiesterase [Kiritimatiellia bacterium]MCO5068474.1 YfcE family phosphodiesterase [Kiritimatiellia bacterium]